MLTMFPPLFLSLSFTYTFSTLSFTDATRPRPRQSHLHSAEPERQDGHAGGRRHGRGAAAEDLEHPRPHALPRPHRRREGHRLERPPLQGLRFLLLGLDAQDLDPGLPVRKLAFESQIESKLDFNVGSDSVFALTCSLPLLFSSYVHFVSTKMVLMIS